MDHQNLIVHDHQLSKVIIFRLSTLYIKDQLHKDAQSVIFKMQIQDIQLSSHCNWV